MEVRREATTTSVSPQVRPKPELRSADASTLRAGYGGRGVRSPLLPGLSFGVEMVQAFKFKVLDASDCGLTPIRSIGCKALPASDWDVAGPQ